MAINLSRAQILSLVAVVTFGIWARIHVFDVRNRTPDEWYYRGFSIVVNQNGLVEGTRLLIAEYDREPWRWQNPPPSRIGFIYLNAFAQKILADDSERAGARVSFVASSLSLILLVGCAAQLMSFSGIMTTALSGAIYPLSLALSRRAWTDSLMELLALTMLCATLSMIRTGKVLNFAGLMFLVGATYSFWVKESASVIVLLIGAVAGLEFLRLRRWRQAAQLSIVGMVAICCGFGTLAVFLGGSEPLVGVYKHIAQAVPQAEYARSYQDGPWTDFIRAFVIIAPGLSIISLMGWLTYLMGLFTRRTSRTDSFQVISYLILIVALYIVAASLPLYFKNLRYLSPVYGLLIIISAYPISSVWNSIGNSQSKRMIVKFFLFLVFSATLIYDYSIFNQIIVTADCPDLNLRMLRQCQESLKAIFLK